MITRVVKRVRCVTPCSEGEHTPRAPVGVSVSKQVSERTYYRLRVWADDLGAGLRVGGFL